MNKQTQISQPVDSLLEGQFSAQPHLGLGLRMLCVLGLTCLLSACSLPRFNLPSAASSVLYIPEVVQGNFVSREQKEFLKPGMSRQQVKEVLGTPLVSSIFHEQRWDYVFTIRRQGVPPQSFSLNVWFKGDVLDRMTGDELPSETEFVTQLVAKKDAPKVPKLQAKEEDLRKYPPRAQSRANFKPCASFAQFLPPA